MASRRIALAAALGVAALGLVGAGAGAQFTDAVTVKQHITAGTLVMRLSSASPGVTVSGDGRNASFADLGPTQSSFSSGVKGLTITNAGTVAAQSVTFSATTAKGADTASDALAKQLCVAITVAGQPYYNGKLTDFPTKAYAAAFPARGQSTATVEFYAGPGTGHAAECAALDDSAQGGSVTPSLNAAFTG